MTVGLLHPGAMGVTVGASCRDDVVWCSAGRSQQTRERAARFHEVEQLDELVARSDVVVAVCPPGAALAVARQVAALGFDGIYVDANAIAPSTARSIGELFDRCVDGGIVGPPANVPGTTRLYLSGRDADAVAERWGDPLDVRAIGPDVGSASAVKIAYAMWTKISAALLIEVRAFARAEGVERALLSEWDISQPGVAGRSETTASGVGPKAWRFVGEMDEMAVACADVGLPDGFAIAAAELYGLLAGLRDVEPTEVDLDRVMATLERRPDRMRAR